MSLLTNSVIDPEEVKSHGTAADPWAAEWMKRNTAGLGPYRLVKNEPGSEVVLEATPNHWRGNPYFERVVIKFVPSEADRVLLLKRKAVDMVSGRPGLSPRSIKSMEGEPGLRIVTLPDTVCHWLCMNTAKTPLSNPKVRQAINYVIPIQAILPNVVQGYGTQMKSPLPSLMPGYLDTESPYKYDLEKARALMRESGGLPDQHQGAGPVLLVLGQLACGTDQRRHVHVVAAGMHDRAQFAMHVLLLDLGRIRKSGVFLNRQAIHVGAQHHRWAITVPHHRDHAGAAHLLRHLVAKGAQLLGQSRRCLAFAKRQLGVLVEMQEQGFEALVEILGHGFMDVCRCSSAGGADGNGQSQRAHASDAFDHAHACSFVDVAMRVVDERESAL